MNNDNLKIIYSQIINGATQFLLDNKISYIKHLSALDSSIIDIKRQEYFDAARNSGAQTYKDRLEEILKNGSWTLEKDKRIQEIKDYIVNLKHSKTKLTTKRDIAQFDKEIERYNVELFGLVREKEKLIGRTAEHYSDKKSNEYYIYISLYSDDKFQNRLFDYEQFNYLEQYELENLVKIYNEKMGVFNDSNLKKIALAPYFMNLLILAGESVRDLFGKAIIELTHYQLELIQFGRQFKNILQNSKTQPDAITLADSDKLLDWFNKSQNVEKLMGNETVQEAPDERILSASRSVVGMSKEELLAQNIDLSAQNRVQEALKKSKSGELDVFELMKLEGHKVG